MIDPLALDENDLIDWCARERVSYAGMFSLRHAAQLSTTYRWDHARRGTVAARLGRPDIFYPHDWLERWLEERDAQRAAVVAQREAELLQRAPAPTPKPNTPAQPAAPAAPRVASTNKRPAPRAAQMGLFERTGT